MLLKSGDVTAVNHLKQYLEQVNGDETRKKINHFITEMLSQALVKGNENRGVEKKKIDIH